MESFGVYIYICIDYVFLWRSLPNIQDTRLDTQSIHLMQTPDHPVIAL